MRMIAIVLFFAALFPSANVGAESTIHCHCFQERTLDPKSPEKIAPYLKATAQNSFLSVAFGMEKFELVRRRMSGTRAEDLWVAGYLGEKTGTAPEALLALRRRAKNWRQVLAGSKMAKMHLDPLFASEVEKGRGDERLAAAAADEILVARLAAKRSELHRLRGSGAGTQEVVLSVFFARISDRTAPEIWEEVRRGDSSWGQLAALHEVRVDEMEKEFAAVIDATQSGASQGPG